MADERLTGRPELTTPSDNDWMEVVDVSDTTDNPAGSTKKTLLSNLVSVLTSYLGLRDTADTTYTASDGFVPMVGYDASLPNPLTLEPNGLILTKLPTFTDIIQGNAIIKGGVIKVTGSNLTYLCWATSYIVNNVHYTTPVFSTVTLSDGDPTNGRIDVFIVRMTGTTPSIVVLEGTPSGTPVKPVPDFLTEVEISFSTVLATATTDPNVVTELIYDQATGEPTEWDNTYLMSGGNLSDGTDPYQGSVSLSLPATLNDYVEWTNDALITFMTDATLVFAMRVPSLWKANSRLEVKLINSSSSDYWFFTLNSQNLRDQGFLTTSADWQQVVIGLGQMIPSNRSATQYDRIELTFVNSAITDLDWVNIQEGQTQPPLDLPILEVVAGTNVTVDATDPQRPIISSSGSDQDIINLGFSGQSGMNCITIGVDGGGDTATNPNVYAWNTILGDWVVADLDLFPFGERSNGGTDISGNNNLAFHIAKRVQEQTGARVNILFDAYSGVPIADWISSGTSSPNWVSFQNMVTASGITKLHGYFWKQGESDNTTAWDLGETYAADLVILRTQVRELFSSLDKVPFVAGELAQKFQLNEKFYSYNNYTKFLDDDNFNVATGKDLDTLPDLVHLTGASVVEQATRYANAFFALPKAKDTKESYEEYDSASDVTYTVPLRTGSEYKFQKIGDSSVYVTKGTGNIIFAAAVGVTILQKDSFDRTNGINSRVRLTKMGINTYILTGDLKDSSIPNPLNGFYGSDDFNDNSIGALWTPTGTAGRITEANSRLEIDLPHTTLELWNDLETSIRTNFLVGSGILTAQSSIQYENAAAAFGRTVFGIWKPGTEGSINGVRIFTSASLAAEAQVQIQIAGANSYSFNTGIICTSLEPFKILYDFSATRVYIYHWNGATWDEIDSATVKTFDLLGGAGGLDAYYTMFDDTGYPSIDFGYFDDFIMHNADYTGLTP